MTTRGTGYPADERNTFQLIKKYNLGGEDVRERERERENSCLLHQIVS